MQQTQEKVGVQTKTSYVDVTSYVRRLEQRSAWVIASLCVLLFFGLSLAVDSGRLFWYDEISTLALVRLPSMAAIWHAMRQPIDASTPTYFLLEKVFDTGLHQTALSARLLSSISVAAGLFVVFNCVSRLVNGLYGLIAMGVLMCSFLPYYSYEARAYGLEFLVASITLWVWLHVKERDWRYAAAFGACFFLGELTHYYFALSLVPYVAFVLLSKRRESRQFQAVVAAIVGIGLAGLILLPAALAIRSLSKKFWAHITVSSLNSFSHFFPYAMVPLAGIAILLTLLSLAGRERRSGQARIPEMTSAEQLGWLFLLTPIAGIILGRFVTHAFVDRYFIGFLPGVAVAVACLCSRLMRGMSFAPAAVALVLLGFGLSEQTVVAAHPDMVDPYHDQQTKTKGAMQLEPKILKDGKQFIVVEQPLLFLEAHYYSHQPFRYPYIPSLNMAGNETTEAITLTNMSHLGWFKLWTMDDLFKNADQTALIDPQEGLVRLLHRNGYKLTVRAVDPLPVFYIEKQ